MFEKREKCKWQRKEKEGTKKESKVMNYMPGIDTRREALTTTISPTDRIIFQKYYTLDD